MGPLRVAQDCALILGLLAFGATFGCAYCGAFTDSTHAWAAAFVSAVLTVICFAAFVGLED